MRKIASLKETEVVVPLHRGNLAVIEQNEHAGPRPDRDGELINILIVDDEPKNLTVLEAILNNPAYRLIRAESADHALLALLVDQFALIVLDIRMPGVSGIELANLIKGRKKTAQNPIIFLTA